MEAEAVWKETSLLLRVTARRRGWSRTIGLKYQWFLKQAEPSTHENLSKHYSAHLKLAEDSHVQDMLGAKRVAVPKHVQLMAVGELSI